jgi:L-amino acid N-acyltransferase YncA/protein-tyrosine-phosphatase
MAKRPVVLFLCVHNAGRSLAASILLEHYAKGRVDVLSAGSEPASELNPSVLAILKERGLDASQEFPKALTEEAAQLADVVVTMGCGDTFPYYPGKRYLEWELDDPAGKPVAEVRPIVDEIDRRVQDLLAELVGSSGHNEIVIAELQIRPLVPSDWPQVSRIYAAGIASGNATFELEPPSWEEWRASHRDDLSFVAVDDAVIGWVAASAVSDRCCYAGVVEHSVYVDPEHHGGGVGRLLLDTLIEATEQQNIWTIQSGIFPENVASVALHRACGFREVGRRERLGQLAGVWRDVLLLERRSTNVA